MGSKQDQLINYIESLKPGTRISVRNLSKSRCVSEGTAYKAIKRAETMGLVKTKPRAGTIRICAQTPSTELLSMAAFLGPLGLTVLAGEEFLSGYVGSVIVGDSSIDQFRHSIEIAIGTPLCVVGDRPEIQRIAVEMGAYLIASGGAPVDDSLLPLAVEHSSCVMASGKDSYALLWLFRKVMTDNGIEFSNDSARNWMSTPLYLYEDDIVADWHKVYLALFSENCRYAVVNDEQMICGVVDAITVLSANPSQKMNNVVIPQGDYCTVDESTSMNDLAEQMISNRRGIAFITDHERLSGIITMNDMLRYYMYRSVQNGPSSVAFQGALEEVSSEKSSGRAFYMIKLPEAIDSTHEDDMLYSFMFSAARRQFKLLFGKKCSFESGTLCSLKSTYQASELMVACEVIQRSELGCTMQVEVHDESSCYARCTYIASLMDDN